MEGGGFYVATLWLRLVGFTYARWEYWSGSRNGGGLDARGRDIGRGSAVGDKCRSEGRVFFEHVEVYRML